MRKEEFHVPAYTVVGMYESFFFLGTFEAPTVGALDFSGTVEILIAQVVRHHREHDRHGERSREGILVVAEIHDAYAWVSLYWSKHEHTIVNME